MVQKCSNPDCNAEFRYASRGRLFSFELRNPTAPCHDVPRAICETKPSHATVSFWLCERCSSKFTLQFTTKTGLALIAAAATNSPPRRPKLSATLSIRWPVQ